MTRERESRTHPIQEDMPFQLRSWLVERAGWVAMGLLALTALTGALGLGPLAEGRARSADQALSVQYERFQRVTRLARFTFGFGAASPDLARLRLSPLFQDAYEIVGIVPAPARSSAGPEGLELTFAPPRTGDLTVVIWANPRRSGSLSLAAQAEAGSAATFWILVYP